MEALVSLYNGKLDKKIKVLLAFRCEVSVIFYEVKWFITFLLIYFFFIVYAL